MDFQLARIVGVLVGGGDNLAIIGFDEFGVFPVDGFLPVAQLR
jgi:hypothetical protein